MENLLCGHGVDGGQLESVLRKSPVAVVVSLVVRHDAGNYLSDKHAENRWKYLLNILNGFRDFLK